MSQRETLGDILRTRLEDFTSISGEKILVCKKNSISTAVSLESLITKIYDINDKSNLDEDIMKNKKTSSFLGSMLFQRGNGFLKF